MEIFDTHAHLLDEHFDEDREELIASLSDSGVKLVMEACTDLDYLEKLLPFVEAHPAIYGAAGLHPEELGPYALSDLDQVAAALAHPKIRAVGEIGLDYYWPENPPREVQKAFFDAQLSLAADRGLPVIVHDREAHGDTVDVLACPSSSTIGRPTGTRWTCCGPTGAGSWASCTASPAAGRPPGSAWTWASAWASAGR